MKLSILLLFFLAFSACSSKTIVNNQERSVSSVQTLNFVISKSDLMNLRNVLIEIKRNGEAEKYFNPLPKDWNEGNRNCLDSNGFLNLVKTRYIQKHGVPNGSFEESIINLLDNVNRSFIYQHADKKWDLVVYVNGTLKGKVGLIKKTLTASDGRAKLPLDTIE